MNKNDDILLYQQQNILPQISSDLNIYRRTNSDPPAYDATDQMSVRSFNIVEYRVFTK